MRFNFRRFAYFTLMGTLALGPAALAQNDAKFSKKAARELKIRSALIQKELGELGTTDWWGKYYEGDGLGANITLLLAPHNGFTFTWDGCLGRYDLNYGPGDLTDERLHLLFQLPNKQGGFQGLSGEFIPVRWGKRHYLVASDELVEFANAVNGGFEPRDHPTGRFLLKTGDEKLSAEGNPQLPEKYQVYLLKQPIMAEISYVKTITVEEQSRVAQISLNAGSAEGVMKGMEFYLYEPSMLFETAKVTSVSEHSSEATIEQYVWDKKSDSDRPSTVWKLSTCAIADVCDPVRAKQSENREASSTASPQE